MMLPNYLPGNYFRQESSLQKHFLNPQQILTAFIRPHNLKIKHEANYQKSEGF